MLVIYILLNQDSTLTWCCVEKDHLGSSRVVREEISGINRLQTNHYYPFGTFYSVTGGQWIFVLDKSGKKAYRRKITIGRQNPQYYEVIEGLEPGEQVIVSGYEAYKDNDVLVFN